MSLNSSSQSEMVVPTRSPAFAMSLQTVEHFDQSKGRLTNLKVLDPKKFLHRSTPISDVTFIEREAEMVSLMRVACALTHELK